MTWAKYQHNPSDDVISEITEMPRSHYLELVKAVAKARVEMEADDMLL